MDNNLELLATNFATSQPLLSIPMDDYDDFVVQYDATVITPPTVVFRPGVNESTNISTISDTGAKNVQTFTFQSKVDSTEGDYITFYDATGKRYAVSINKSNNGSGPSGSIWDSISKARKQIVQIGNLTTAIDVATKVLSSMLLIEELSNNCSIVNNLDGSLTITQNYMGTVNPTLQKNSNDSGPGGITYTVNTIGAASNLNGKYFSLYEGGTNNRHIFWYDVNNEGLNPGISAVPHRIAIDTGDSAILVATKTNTIINNLTEFNSTVFATTVTATCTTNGDTTTATADNSGFTVSTNISGVDDAFKGGFLDGILYIANHGIITGTKMLLTTDGTLPGGLSSTDYYVRAIDENNISLHPSGLSALNNVLKVTFSDSGTGNHSLNPEPLAGGNIKMQESIDGSNWFDIAGVNANLTTDSIGLLQSTSKCSMIRPYLTLTSGQLFIELKVFTKDN